MKKLTKAQKKQIAKLAVEKSETVENGTLHVYRSDSGFNILVNSEYRDDEHEYLFGLKVWNESKPCSQASFLRQIEILSNH